MPQGQTRRLPWRETRLPLIGRYTINIQFISKVVWNSLVLTLNWLRLLLRPRVLRDVSYIDTSATLFGKKYPVPIGISPSAMQKLAGGNGEIDVAKAAARFDTTMILSTMTTSSLEDVINAPGTAVDFWFQLYISRSGETCARVIRRAEGNHINSLICRG